jgi:Zn-dependent protease
MKYSELLNILAAVIVLALVASFSALLKSDFTSLAKYFLFSLIIIAVAVFSKKLMANYFDADVEHKIWGTRRYWFRPHDYIEKEIPLGILLPLFFSIFTLGALKLTTLLTYETSALKRRAAKRHGYYSYVEMTDWHNGAIGAAGIFGILVLSAVAYLLPIPGLESLAKLAAFYAFFNMLPLVRLDGSQIFIGSRVLYTILAVITLIFMAYALFLF